MQLPRPAAAVALAVAAAAVALVPATTASAAPAAGTVGPASGAAAVAYASQSGPMGWTETASRVSGGYAGSVTSQQPEAFSPDGTTLAYVDQATEQVLTRPADNTGSPTPASPKPSNPDSEQYAAPTYAPDGTLVFVHVQSTDQSFTEDVVRGNGTAAPAVLQANAYSPAFDGSGNLYYLQTTPGPPSSGSTARCLVWGRTGISGTDDHCVLTDAALAGLFGTGTAATDVLVDGIGAGGDLVSVDAGDFVSSTYEIGVLDVTDPSSPSARLLAATRSPVDARAVDSRPYGDDQVLYLQDDLDNEPVKAVDATTGTHLATVIPATAGGPFAVRPSTGTATRSAYAPLAAPARVLDTRDGTGTGTVARLAAGHPIDVSVAGVCPGATAVQLGVIGIQPTTGAYVTVYPTGLVTPPTVSTLNLAPKQTAGNAAVVKVGTGGKVTLLVSNGTIDVAADVYGCFTPLGTGLGSTQSTFTAFASPQRVMDTRDGTGGVAKAAIGTGRYVDLVLPSSIPAATSVVLNLGGIATPNTYVTAYPSPGTTAAGNPNVSTLNLAAGETRAVLATVTVPASRTIRFYVSVGPVQVFADAVGYYHHDLDGDAYVPVSPTRIFDTRDGTGAVNGAAGRVTGGGRALLRGSGQVTTPYGDVAAAGDTVLGNLTAVLPTNGTYLSLGAGPASTGAPSYSTLNANARTITPNLALTALSQPAGEAQVYNSIGTVDVLYDIAGYYLPARTTTAA